MAGRPGASGSPESPEKTARALASAIDRYLFDPPAVAQAPRHSITSFDRELLAAYEAAFNVGPREVPHRAKVWAFPSGKPQVFADTAGALSEGVMVYGFGCCLPRWKQGVLAIQLRVPVLRLMVAERTVQPTPVCGWAVWHKIQSELERRNAKGPLQWIHFQSQWGKDRSNVLGLTRDSDRLFVVVQPVEKTNVQDRLRPPGSFRVPT